MRISEAMALFERSLTHKRRILFVGPPGVGKTVMKMDACRRAGWDYLGICTPLADPAFLLGYPYRVNGTADHAPFGQLARALEATKPTFLDFDELGGATETVVKAALRLFQFGEVGQRRLPDCVVLGASSNDVGHGAGVMGLLEPMKDRFHTILQVEPHIDDTVTYGLAAGWPSDLLAFLRNDPSALSDWKPCKTMQSGGATPRGWGDVAEWINLGVEDSEVICGKVGKAAGTKYLAFRELIGELPDVDAVILDPAGSPVPENPSARFLVSMALASKLTAGNFGQVLTYLNRLPAMFRAYSIRDAFQAERTRRADGKLPAGWKPLSGSRDFSSWACSEDGKAVIGAAS